MDTGFAFALIGLPGLVLGALMVHRLVGMVLFHEISVGEFAVLVLIFGGLLAAGYAAEDLAMKMLFVIPALLLAIATSGIHLVTDHLGKKQMRTEDVGHYLEAIERHPDLPYSYVRLGDLFYESRDWELAVQYYEESSQLAHDPHVSYNLKRARERVAIGKGPAVQCTGCGRLNPTGARECLYCSAPLPGLHEIFEALGAGLGRAVMLIAAGSLLGGGVFFALSDIGAEAMNTFMVGCGLVALMLYVGTVNFAAPRRPLRAKRAPGLKQVPVKTDYERFVEEQANDR